MKQLSPAEADAALAPYRALLDRYRSTLDLMSPKGYARLEEHIDDALAYARVLAGLSPAPARLLDVGAGAGLPGLAIAVSLPELEVELVERRRKRATFLSLAVGAVGADRVSVRSGDVRRLDGPPVEVVTAQAVGSLVEVYELTRHRHEPRVTLASRKGPGWRDEVTALEVAIGSAAAVVAEVALGRRGTLVAVRATGGRRCRSSV